MMDPFESHRQIEKNLLNRIEVERRWKKKKQPKETIYHIDLVLQKME